jgi:hypothetical protein
MATSKKIEAFRDWIFDESANQHGPVYFESMMPDEAEPLRVSSRASRDSR